MGCSDARTKCGRGSGKRSWGVIGGIEWGLECSGDLSGENREASVVRRARELAVLQGTRNSMCLCGPQRFCAGHSVSVLA